MTKIDQPLNEDREAQAIAQLYATLQARQEAARERRISEGRATYTDLDAGGRCLYMREKQRQSRARRRDHAQCTGSVSLDAGSMKDALADAVMILLAAGDDRVDAILELASRAFEIPSVAAATIRRRATQHKPKLLTPDRLPRSIQ